MYFYLTGHVIYSDLMRKMTTNWFVWRRSMLTASTFLSESFIDCVLAQLTQFDVGRNRLYSRILFRSSFFHRNEMKWNMQISFILYVRCIQLNRSWAEKVNNILYIFELVVNCTICHASDVSIKLHDFCCGSHLRSFGWKLNDHLMIKFYDFFFCHSLRLFLSNEAIKYRFLCRIKCFDWFLATNKKKIPRFVIASSSIV